MKRIESILLILVISVFSPLSISAQGYLEVYLKNGMHHRFYLDTFKELRTSKQSVDGMLSSDYITQQVVMNDSTYSYALADVDSIRFKKVTMDDMVDDMFTVLNEISPMLSDVNDITEAERFVDDIKACHNVRDAYVSGTSLHIVMEHMNTLTFYYDKFDEISVDDVKYIARRTAPKTTDSQLTNRKALLVNQHWQDQNRISVNNMMLTLKDVFEDMNVEVKYVTESFDIDFFADTNFADYDYIFLITHGSYNPKTGTHSLLTSKSVVPDPTLKDYTKEEIKRMLPPNTSCGVVKENRSGKDCYVFYFEVNERDISAKRDQSEKMTILFNVACRSLMGNKNMSYAFEKRGVDIYCGYDETNSTGPAAGLGLWGGLLNGLSFEKSIDNIPDEWKNDIYGNRSLHGYLHHHNDTEQAYAYFAFPVITDTYNDEKDINYYLTSENKLYVSVEAAGRAFAYQKDESLSFGFKYGTKVDQLNNECIISEESEVQDYAFDEYYHKHVFSSSIWLENVGDYVYYRAYSYDGINYNEGNIIEVKLPELSELRKQLIRLYYSNDGDNWKKNYNWCTNKPIDTWYGVKLNGDKVSVDLGYNGLKGKGDFSSCTALRKLYCENNQLTSLDVSGCTALQSLDCYRNQLTNIDVSGCTALQSLDCDDNQLTSLNVSGCTALEYLSCENNQLTSLNVSGCTALYSLDCDDNQLTGLDVSGCTALRKLYCVNNHINQEIPEFFFNFSFIHDWKYNYEYDDRNHKWIITTNEYGWWYPGEPESHHHGW